MADTLIYVIDSTDGNPTSSFTIQPRIEDGPNGLQWNTDLTLYGNAAPNWGEAFNENFYHLLETFACDELDSTPGRPKTENELGTGRGINNPVVGQLWFNKTVQQLFVYGAGDIWIPVGTGDQYVSKLGDTMSGQLIINTGSSCEGGLRIQQDLRAGMTLGVGNSYTHIFQEVNAEQPDTTFASYIFKITNNNLNTVCGEVEGDTAFAIKPAIDNYNAYFYGEHMYAPQTIVNHPYQFVPKWYVDAVLALAGARGMDIAVERQVLTSLQRAATELELTEVTYEPTTNGSRLHVFVNGQKWNLNHQYEEDAGGDRISIKAPSELQPGDVVEFVVFLSGLVGTPIAEGAGPTEIIDVTSSCLDHDLLIRAPSGPLMKMEATSVGASSPAILMYNIDNDPLTPGVPPERMPYTRLSNRDGMVISLESSTVDNGACDDTPSPGQRWMGVEYGTGVMRYYGSGDGATDDDIIDGVICPNLTIPSINKDPKTLITKEYADALLSGGATPTITWFNRRYDTGVVHIYTIVKWFISGFTIHNARPNTQVTFANNIQAPALFVGSPYGRGDSAWAGTDVRTDAHGNVSYVVPTCWWENILLHPDFVDPAHWEFQYLVRVGSGDDEFIFDPQTIRIHPPEDTTDYDTLEPACYLDCGDAGGGGACDTSVTWVNYHETDGGRVEVYPQSTKPFGWTVTAGPANKKVWFWDSIKGWGSTPAGMTNAQGNHEWIWPPSAYYNRFLNHDDKASSEVDPQYKVAFTVKVGIGDSTGALDYTSPAANAICFDGQSSGPGFSPRIEWIGKQLVTTAISGGHKIDVWPYWTGHQSGYSIEAPQFPNAYLWVRFKNRTSGASPVPASSSDAIFGTQAFTPGWRATDTYGKLVVISNSDQYRTFANSGIDHYYQVCLSSTSHAASSLAYNHASILWKSETIWIDYHNNTTDTLPITTPKNSLSWIGPTVRYNTTYNRWENKIYPSTNPDLSGWSYGFMLRDTFPYAAVDFTDGAGFTNSQTSNQYGDVSYVINYLAVKALPLPRWYYVKVNGNTIGQCYHYK